MKIQIFWIPPPPIYLSGRCADADALVTGLFEWCFEGDDGAAAAVSAAEDEFVPGTLLMAVGTFRWGEGLNPVTLARIQLNLNKGSKSRILITDHKLA